MCGNVPISAGELPIWSGEAVLRLKDVFLSFGDAKSSSKGTVRNPIQALQTAGPYPTRGGGWSPLPKLENTPAMIVSLVFQSSAMVIATGSRMKNMMSIS